MNYNVLQRVNSYSNIMNSNYNINIPTALPLIRNNHYDHSNITVAPPIPSFYKQNINSSNYYSHLPNIMNITYSSAENIAKKFSNNLKNLQNLEDQITEKNHKFNLQKLNQIENEKNLKYKLREDVQNKLKNGNDDEDIKEKISKVRQVVGRIPDYKTEEQKKSFQNKELMTEEVLNKFNMNLDSALSEYSNNIKNIIKSKNNNDTNLYEKIKQGIDNLKADFSERIDNFNKESMRNMDLMQKLMNNSSNPRLQLLSEHLFSTDDSVQILKLKKKKIKKSYSDIDNINMPLFMEKVEENIKSKNNEAIVEKIPLDLWEKNRKKALVINKAIKEKVAFYSQSYFKLQPLNKFRSYVFLVMAARRMLNIRYILYKEIKFDTVSYYINNFEDMDIILKKLVYNTVKEPLLEILNDTKLNINFTYYNEDNDEVYKLLQDYIERIINGFNTKFFNGVSSKMLSYLSLYVTNQSFIPKEFFTTFELVRFRTTETGEFIELDDNNRKMILIFYIFIKILLRNVFLELMFNKAVRKKLSWNVKLNIKMLVSILYRSIIKNLTKNCGAKTNLDNLEETEDITAFLKLRFKKREFHLHQFLKKDYFLKISQEDANSKKIRKRVKQPISPRKNEYTYNNGDLRKIRETKNIEKEEKNKNNSVYYNDDNEDENNQSQNDNINNGDEKENGDSEKEESIIMNKSKEKSKGKLPPPRMSKNQNSFEEEEESEIVERKSKSSKSISNKKLKSKSISKNSSNLSSVSSNLKERSNITKSGKNSTIQEELNENSNEEDEKDDVEKKGKGQNKEDEELDFFDDYKKEKLMPKRKVSTEKEDGKIKTRLIGEEQNLKITTRLSDRLKEKNTIKDFSKSDITKMYFIIQNFQSYGDDIDSNEVDLLDKVLYSNKYLKTYYLYTNEYNFDPGEMISNFMDKLLEKIQINFSK